MIAALAGGVRRIREVIRRAHGHGSVPVNRPDLVGRVVGALSVAPRPFAVGRKPVVDDRLAAANRLVPRVVAVFRIGAEERLDLVPVIALPGRDVPIEPSPDRINGGCSGDERRGQGRRRT